MTVTFTTKTKRQKIVLGKETLPDFVFVPHRINKVHLKLDGIFYQRRWNAA
jgi:hypothetical protein